MIGIGPLYGFYVAPSAISLLNQRISETKNFKQNLRRQVVEAEMIRGEAKVIQKLALSHPWFEH